MRGVRPRSCSHKSHTSGASRRLRHSLAGVTRRAANRAAHGRLVPLRQVTRRQAQDGNARATARTVRGPRVVHQHQLRARSARARAGRNMNRGRATKHRQVARDPERIRQLPPDAACAATRGDIPEYPGVRHDSSHAQTRAAGASNQRERLAPFLLKRRVGSEGWPPLAGPHPRSRTAATTARRPAATRG